MWPKYLEMDVEQASVKLRRIELEAFGSVVSALRAQGELNRERRKILSDLSSAFNVSQERQKTEIRRAVNDELLATIAVTLNGPDVENEWAREGRRIIPLLRRAAPITAFSSAADSVKAELEERNLHLQPPYKTKTAKKRTLQANQGTMPYPPPSLSEIIYNGGSEIKPPQISMPPSTCANQSPLGDVVVLPSGMAVRYKEEKTTIKRLPDEEEPQNAEAAETPENLEQASSSNVNAKGSAKKKRKKSVNKEVEVTNMSYEVFPQGVFSMPPQLPIIPKPLPPTEHEIHQAQKVLHKQQHQQLLQQQSSSSSSLTGTPEPPQLPVTGPPPQHQQQLQHQLSGLMMATAAAAGQHLPPQQPNLLTTNNSTPSLRGESSGRRARGSGRGRRAGTSTRTPRGAKAKAAALAAAMAAGGSGLNLPQIPNVSQFTPEMFAALNQLTGGSPAKLPKTTGTRGGKRKNARNGGANNQAENLTSTASSTAPGLTPVSSYLMTTGSSQNSALTNLIMSSGFQILTSVAGTSTQNNLTSTTTTTTTSSTPTLVSSSQTNQIHTGEVSANSDSESKTGVGAVSTTTVVLSATGVGSSYSNVKVLQTLPTSSNSSTHTTGGATATRILPKFIPASGMAAGAGGTPIYMVAAPAGATVQSPVSGSSPGMVRVARVGTQPQHHRLVTVSSGALRAAAAAAAGSGVASPIAIQQNSGNLISTANSTGSGVTANAFIRTLQPRSSAAANSTTSISTSNAGLTGLRLPPNAMVPTGVSGLNRNQSVIVVARAPPSSSSSSSNAATLTAVATGSPVPPASRAVLAGPKILQTKGGKPLVIVSKSGSNLAAVSIPASTTTTIASTSTTMASSSPVVTTSSNSNVTQQTTSNYVLLEVNQSPSTPAESPTKDVQNSTPTKSNNAAVHIKPVVAVKSQAAANSLSLADIMQASGISSAAETPPAVAMEETIGENSCDVNSTAVENSVVVEQPIVEETVSSHPSEKAKFPSTKDILADSMQSADITPEVSSKSTSFATNASQNNGGIFMPDKGDLASLLDNPFEPLTEEVATTTPHNSVETSELEIPISCETTLSSTVEKPQQNSS